MRITILLLFLSTNIFGQFSEKEINKYVQRIDSLKKVNALSRFDYPNMSFCGGGVHGLFYQDKLVFLDAIYQGELGYSGRTMYFKDSAICKIIYREHYPEWEKYKTTFPQDSSVINPAKMTYTDTLYTILITDPVKVTKSSNKKFIDNTIRQELLSHLLDCGRRMRIQLEVERGKQ